VRTRIPNKRSVGHADGPDHEIFREFIKHERDEIIHRYTLGISEGPVFLAAGAVGPHGEVTPEAHVLDETLYRPMSTETYEGEDGKTLVEDAITWWETQLGEIDAMLETSV
jgi:hypothetical protein